MVQIPIQVEDAGSEPPWLPGEGSASRTDGLTTGTRPAVGTYRRGGGVGLWEQEMRTGAKSGGVGVAETISEEVMMAYFSRAAPAQKIHGLLSLPWCLSVCLTCMPQPTSCEHARMEMLTRVTHASAQRRAARREHAREHPLSWAAALAPPHPVTSSISQPASGGLHTQPCAGRARPCPSAHSRTCTAAQLIPAAHDSHRPHAAPGPTVSHGATGKHCPSLSSSHLSPALLVGLAGLGEGCGEQQERGWPRLHGG